MSGPRRFSRRLRGWSVLLWALAAGAAAAQSESEVCDARLRPLAGAIGYDVREPGRRCEGLYESSIGAASLEIVSFVEGGLSFDLKRHHELRVAAAGLRDEDVRVRAVALPPKTYYRMDGVLSGDEALVWPVGDVLRPAGLGPARVGIFGWIGSENDKTFVPLIVVPESEQPNPEAAAQLRLRTPVDLERLMWRSAPEDEGQNQPWQDVGRGPLRAGDTADVTLPPGRAGIMRVDFAAKRPNSDQWLTLRLRVVRPG